jgi:poly(A) polymerase
VTDAQWAALAELLRRPAVARVLAALDRDGEETRIVGGAVRNALLGRPVSDIDMTTTALPATTMAWARGAGFHAIPTGIEHGTVTVVADGVPVEVTTLREDVETDGRRALVRFGRSFAADAERRDFTINALSLGRDGMVHDTVGGLADLAAGRVRFIGDARTRIREDYLRVLRFFRFHAAYATGPLDADGLAAAIAERDGLATLSAERVRTELLKLLTAPRGVEAVAAMSEGGLLVRLVGGVGDLGRLARSGDLPEAAKAVAADAATATTRLAALAVFTTEDADRLRERLRLSNAEHARLEAYAGLLARLHGLALLDTAEMRRLAVAFGAPALVEALAVLRGEPRPMLTPDAEALRGRYAAGLETAPVFPLSGRDLVARGVPPGPDLGRRLAAARTKWLEAGCPEDADVEDLLDNS